MLRQKIEEIRRKPQHERLRYVWACVAISMVVIVSLWFFSVKEMFAKNNNAEQNDQLGKKIEEATRSLPKMNDLKNNATDTSKEGISAQSLGIEEGFDSSSR